MCTRIRSPCQYPVRVFAGKSTGDASWRQIHTLSEYIRQKYFGIFVTFQTQKDSASTMDTPPSGRSQAKTLHGDQGGAHFSDMTGIRPVTSQLEQASRTCPSVLTSRYVRFESVYLLEETGQ